jgi:hypothetical protein
MIMVAFSDTNVIHIADWPAFEFTAISVSQAINASVL